MRVDIYYYFFFIGVKFLEIELKWTNKLNWNKVASAWNLRPGFNTLVGHRFYQSMIILNLAY